MKPSLFLLIFFTASRLSIAQPKVFNTHISTEDGLPQKTVMNIVQDSRGFMWFSTWNGICKYDGVNFYSYKVKKADSRILHSDRFDGMWIDKFGYIWLNTYENQMYRFDPRTERYMSLNSLEKFRGLNFTTHGIIINPSGKKWLLNPNLGCICFKDSVFNPVLISKQTHLLKNNHVRKVYEDAQGNSWVLTDGGLCRFSTDLKTSAAFFAGARPERFYCALQIGPQIWFGTDSGNVYQYNTRQGRFYPYKMPTSAPVKFLKKINNRFTLLASDKDDFFVFDNQLNKLQGYRLSQLSQSKEIEIRSCYADRSGNVWLQTNGPGVSKLNTRTGQFKHFNPAAKPGPKDQFAPRFYIWEDIANRLWIQPNDGGLSLYNAATDRLVPFEVPSVTTPAMPLLLHTGYSDMQGNLWVSTRQQGLNKVQFNNTGFRAETVDTDGDENVNNEVRSIMDDHLGRKWVATKGGKIFIYNSRHQQIGYLTKTGKIARGEALDGITYSMTEDLHHTIWIGTKGKGLYRLTPRADSSTYNVSHYQHNDNDNYSLSDDRVYSVFVDPKYQRIWVGTYGGGINLVDDQTDGRFYHSDNKLTGYPGADKEPGCRVRAIGTDAYGNIYAGTPSGLWVAKPNYNNISGTRFQHFERSPAEGSLAGNDIYDIYTTRKGVTYLASFGGGLDKVTERNTSGIPVKFYSYTTENGLSSDLVQQIEEDVNGNLWLATESTVSRLDPERQLFETYHDINRLLKGDILSEGGSTHTHDGLILMGFAGGMITIDPAKLVKETFSPYVALTGFRVANKYVPVSDTTALPQDVDYLKHVELSHEQNFISFEFAALDMKNTREIGYAYKLDGIDTGWVYTHQRSASYGNLSPGKYIFRVRSNNGYGLWPNNEHHIVVEIHPAFWQTYWALALYIIAAALLTFFGMRWVYRYFRLKDRLILEHEQMEMKTNFFTDVSHEIRTPLTMIVSPLEHLLEQEPVTPKVKESLQLMHKNATRMLRLVNQVLDFRKIESQLLIVRELNAGELIADIAATFQPVATMQRVNLKVNNQAANKTIWADKENLEKLVYNLLSNALKNTAEGDTVKVEIYQQQSELAIRIEDSGRGMSNELLKKLFTRFLSYNPNKSQPSTGIGLSIVKEIVDRHHARIAVESSERVGSTFTVYFQNGNAHFKDDANVVLLKTGPAKPELTLNDKVEAAQTVQAEITKNSILVVEDDDDLRHYIVEILQPYYHVSQAANGEDGMEKALSETPDFILSDLMMPGVDGLGLLKKLRNNAQTSHIPVVFLTARADQETEMLAYNNGADAFITKPFSTKVLQSRIKTIIERRKYLHQASAIKRPEQAAFPQTNNAPKLTKHDEQFLKKLRTDIEKHIADADYSVENLIATMPMSRTVFVKKLKGLTGQSPIEFIRYVKIHHAARLMETEHYSIKELSHLIGIADTKYFAQRFKEVMGVMPSEYKNRLKQG